MARESKQRPSDPRPRPVSEYLEVLEAGRQRRQQAFLQIEEWAGEEYEEFQRNLRLLSQEHGQEFRCPGIVRRRWEL
ncbi:MAG TPA: hypothetical protein VLE47_01560 [Candidatus Saccharimonadales bacterium]|nr:hypothetical protein [Candidatus Saccharimonadales bacterium]